MPYYKGFDENLKCLGKQYIVGKDMFSAVHGEVVPDEPASILFYENLFDAFHCYNPFDGSRYCEVKPLSDVVSKGNERYANGIHVIREIYPEKKLGLNIHDARAFIEQVKRLDWFDRHGTLPDSCKLFDSCWAAWNKDTRSIASRVAEDALKDAVQKAVMKSAQEAERDAARIAATNATVDAVLESAGDAVYDAAWRMDDDESHYIVYDNVQEASRYISSDVAMDAALACVMRYICGDLNIDQKYRDYIEKRWSVWEAGYGVACDVDGVLYCY